MQPDPIRQHVIAGQDTCSNPIKDMTRLALPAGRCSMPLRLENKMVTSLLKIEIFLMT